MAHYTVLVIHEKNQSINDLMAPYKESPLNYDSKWDYYVECDPTTIKKLYSIREHKYVSSGPLDEDIDFCIDNRIVYNRALNEWNICLADADKIRDVYYNDPIFYATTIELASSFTFAVVTPDGVWHSPNNDLFFGYSPKAEEGKKNWILDYDDNYIKPNRNKGLYVTLLDCHA
jgi:hypothetical protein